MRKIYKRLFVIMLAVVLCLGFDVYNPKADAYVSVSATSETSIGGSVSVSISVGGDNISAYTIWVSYDSSVLQYNSGSGAIINGGGGTVAISGTSAGTISLSFTAIANGSSGIYSSGEVLSIEGDLIPTSFGGATVTVAPPNNNNNGGNNGGDNNQNNYDDDRSSNCYLYSLEVSPGKLDPEFSPYEYEYTVKVEKGTKEIFVSAEADDNKASTRVYGADELNDGENQVEIVVTAENGSENTYVLNVIVGDVLEDVVVNINGGEYKFVNFEDKIKVPENFTKTTVKYKEFDVLAFESPNKKITIVCMNDKFNNMGFFIYDKEKQTFTEYKEFSSKLNRYIILPFPEGAKYPDSFVLTEIRIMGENTSVYSINEPEYADKYVFYGMNIDGEEGYYIYDDLEKTFMRFVIPSNNTNADKVEPEDVVVAETEIVKEKDNVSFLPEFFNREVLFYIVCGIGGLLLILFICLIAFGVKIGKLNKELDSKNTKLVDDSDADFNFADDKNGFDELSPKEDENNNINESVESESEVSASEELPVNEVQSADEAPDNEVPSSGDVSDNDVKSSDEILENASSSEEENTENESPSVAEIPTVDISLDDAEEMSKESERINSIVNSESYSADNDSAF